LLQLAQNNGLTFIHAALPIVWPDKVANANKKVGEFYSKFFSSEGLVQEINDCRLNQAQACVYPRREPEIVTTAAARPSQA